MSIEQMDAFEIEQLNRDAEKLTKNKEKLVREIDKNNNKLNNLSLKIIDAEEYRQNLAFEKKRKLTIEDRIGVAIMGTKIEVVTLKSSSK